MRPEFTRNYSACSIRTPRITFLPYLLLMLQSTRFSAPVYPGFRSQFGRDRYALLMAVPRMKQLNGFLLSWILLINDEKILVKIIQSRKSRSACVVDLILSRYA